MFQVRARDLGGSVDPSPAEHSFTVAAAPDTGIVADAPGTPGAETESTTATFTFDSAQDGVTFECSLDRAPEPVFEPCTSPVTYTDLAQGEHEFLVRARGATGVVDPEPAEFSWVIGDLTPPTLALLSGPSAETADTSATFTWEASEPGLTFTCTLDGVQPGGSAPRRSRWTEPQRGRARPRGHREQAAPAGRAGAARRRVDRDERPRRTR